jgi:hypothetical protein
MQASTSPYDTIVASAWSRMMVPNGSLSPFLAACKARGWMKARGTPRTDATHVRAAIRTLHRLARVLETLRAALNQRSAADAAWVHRHVPVAWYARDGPRAEAMRLPKEGFQEHLPENVRLGDMRDWRTVPSTVKTEV